MPDNLANTCEGTSGTAVSTANSAGPNQFNAATATGTGTTCTWDNAHAHSGTTSMKGTLASGVASSIIVDWTAAITPTPVANAYLRCYVYMTAYPTVNSRVLAFIGAAASQGALQIITTGAIRTVSNTSQLAPTTAVIPLNAWCRLEFDNVGNTGTAATLNARMFSGANLEGSTPDSGGSVSTAAQVTTALTSTARIAQSSTVTETALWNLWMDDIAFSDTASPGSSLVTAGIPDIAMAPMTGA